jgi:uncharacterized protein YneR
MSKINSRSPYYINHTVSSSAMTNVRINLWIYTGTQTTSRPSSPTYVLESTPINGSVQIDIASLVKDYFEPSHTSSEILWVDYRIDEYEVVTETYNAYSVTTAYAEGIAQEICDTSSINYTSDKTMFFIAKTDAWTETNLREYPYHTDLTSGEAQTYDGVVILGDSYNTSTKKLELSQPIIDAAEDDVSAFTRYGGHSNFFVLNGSDNTPPLITFDEQTATCSSGNVFAGNDNLVIVDTFQLSTSQWNEGATTTQLEGFYGYGYFEDGSNPQINDAILLSSDYIVRNEDEDIKIPYNNNQGTGLIQLKQGSLFVRNKSLSASTDSSIVIDYITESSPINEITFIGGVSINVTSYCETKYNPYKVTFINKYGALEDVWFFKNNKIDLNVETESFRRNIVSGGSYSLQDHQYNTLKKQGRETITLNSGFYPEGANETFRQLLFSDYAWITHEGNVLPIQIKDSSFNFKTRLTDRVINYTMQFEFAFDKINTVR